MPRRIKTKNKEKDWRWYASFILNGAVALSMVLGTVFVFAGASTTPRTVAPTSTVAPIVTTPAAAPTATPADSAPQATPTPKASVQGLDSLPSQVVYLVAEPAIPRALEFI